MIAISALLPHQASAQSQVSETTNGSMPAKSTDKPNDREKPVPDLDGIPIYPGSDLASFLNQLRSEPSDTAPRDHGR